MAENRNKVDDKCKAFLADIDRQIDEFRASLRPDYIATIYSLEDSEMCIYKGKHLGINIAIPSGNLLSLSEVLHPEHQDDEHSTRQPHE